MNKEKTTNIGILRDILNIADPMLLRRTHDEDIYTAIKKYRTEEERNQLEFLFDQLPYGNYIEKRVTCS